MVTGCCGCCAPRYKRLVDSVFPRDPQDGLVKANMEKLTFYVLSSPEKLDRVGEYLFQKVSRDIYRKKNGCVVIGVEAMDGLLQACHSQSLNLYVESFLRMVQKLLESPDPNFQILATQSFVRFASIEEDTPSYHRRYDFFVSKFASMAHNNSSNDLLRSEIRAAGIRGLKGVVRKTVSDELVENIWDSSHMEKIIPSLLFNMEQGRKSLVNEETDAGTQETEEAPRVAESTMRDLVNKATFGHVRSIVKPVLHHFDVFELWVPNDFAVHTFRVLMFSIQSQYSYAVIETLMSHMEGANGRCSGRVRTAMADVLARVIDIAAGESVGPSVLEIVNALVGALGVSVALNARDVDEVSYRDTLISALGEYVTHLPDYQKIEIMKFIMAKVPKVQIGEEDQRLLQNMLLKSLLMVGSKYRTVQLSTTFPLSFLGPLLTLSKDDDPELRLLVHSILHTLLDRHENREKLGGPALKFEGLTRESVSRSDLLFIRKTGPELFAHTFLSLECPNNGLRNMSAVWKTGALLMVELLCDDTLGDFLRLLVSLQDAALVHSSPAASGDGGITRIHLHVLAVSLLALLAHLLPALQGYADKIIKARKTHSIHMLPPLKARYEVYEPSSTPPATALLNHGAMIEALKAAGIEPSPPTTSGSGRGSAGYPRHSWVDSAHTFSAANSTIDISGVSVEVDSGASTPSQANNNRGGDTVPEIVTVDAFKSVLNESVEVRREVENARRADVRTSFRTAPFEDLVSKAAARGGNLQVKLSEIFTRIAMSDSSMPPPHSPLINNNLSTTTNAIASKPMNGHLPSATSNGGHRVTFPQVFSL